MTKLAGYDFTLELMIGGVWVPVEAQRSITTTVSNEQSEATAKGDGWRVDDGCGTRSGQITVRGLTSDGAAFKALRAGSVTGAWFYARAVSLGYSVQIEGTYQVASFAIAGDYNDAETFDCTLVGDGELVDSRADAGWVNVPGVVGYWDDPATWIGNTVPPDGAVVYIRNGHVLDRPGQRLVRTGNDVRIRGGGIWCIGNFNSYSPSLDYNGLLPGVTIRMQGGTLRLSQGTNAVGDTGATVRLEHTTPLIEMERHSGPSAPQITFDELVTAAGADTVLDVECYTAANTDIILFFKTLVQTVANLTIVPSRPKLQTTRGSLSMRFTTTLTIPAGCVLRLDGYDSSMRVVAGCAFTVAGEIDLATARTPGVSFTPISHIGQKPLGGGTVRTRMLVNLEPAGGNYNDFFDSVLWVVDGASAVFRLVGMVNGTTYNSFAMMESRNGGRFFNMVSNGFCILNLWGAGPGVFSTLTVHYGGRLDLWNQSGDPSGTLVIYINDLVLVGTPGGTNDGINAWIAPGIRLGVTNSITTTDLERFEHTGPSVGTPSSPPGQITFAVPLTIDASYRLSATARAEVSSTLTVKSLRINSVVISPGTYAPASTLAQFAGSGTVIVQS